MIRLLIIGLKSYWRLMAGLMIACLPGFLIMHSTAPGIVISTCLGFFISITSARNHWYLQLPYSRKKIAALVVAQILIGFLVSWTLFFVFIKIYELVVPVTPAPLKLHVLSFFGGMALTLMTLLGPLPGVPKPRTNLIHQKWTKSAIRNTALVVLAIVGFIWLTHAHEKIAVLFSTLIVPFIFLVAFSQQIVLAPQTHKKALWIARVGIGVAVVISAAAFFQLQ